MENKALHIGIIPDGNRRWAKERGLPMKKGHERGSKVTEEIVFHILDNYPEIKEITVWVFSTENFKRDEQEKSMIFNYIRKGLESIKSNKRFLEKEVKVNVISQTLDSLPSNLMEAARQTTLLTRDYGNRILNIGLGYGGRHEITRAAISFAKWLKEKPLVKQVKEMVFEDFLEVRTPLDLVIRTGGEKRLSGFMLYQMAYAELFFTDTLWPDFSTDEFDKIMKEFNQRRRKFGT